MKICAFMWTYYGYPNSNYEGKNVEVMRCRNGEIMARNEMERGTMPDVDYVAGVPEFESLKIAEQMEEDVFGCLPSQTGYCYGYSSFLNALEWHTCSEVNIAVTPLVLMLATRFDLKDNKLDASQVKAFYVPAGTAIEVYATTLHFCPCQVEDTGFGCVVGLLKGTNLPHEEEREDKFLFRKNKWLIAHNGNAGLLARGAVPGISGENYQLQY